MKTRRNLNSRSAGFTLVEIMVSMALLALLCLFVLQLVGGATSTSTSVTKRVDADAEARLIFNRIGSDLARILRRSDLDFYGKDTTVFAKSMPGNDQLAFYSLVPGYYSSPSPTPTPTRNERNPASLVAYCLSSAPNGMPQIVRLSKGLVWQPNSGFQDLGYLPLTIVTPGGRWPNLFATSTASPAPISGMADADFEPLADSAVRFEYQYLIRASPYASPPRPARLSIIPYDDLATNPAHTARDFHTDVASMIVTIVILDSLSRTIVSDFSHVSSGEIFADANGADLAPIWSAKINSPSFAATANVPQSAASAFRVYEREFQLASVGP